MAAQFANIGMVGLPDDLLTRSCALSEAERRLLASHTLFGARLLERAGLQDLDIAVLVARHHHERWDGGGYPEGLMSREIPEAARIIALCDAFEAMVHPRPWRAEPMSLSSALEEIGRNAGTQFDPELAEVFITCIERESASHVDFDTYLGEEADEDAYVRAREQIERLLTNASYSFA
jgi:putative two-component system response regulator